MRAWTLFAGGLTLWAATAAAQADVDRGNFGPFKRSLNTTPYGYAVVADPTGQAPVAKVERFEVRSGDCGTEAFDDCANDRERSELSEHGARNREGDDWWYGWSLYVPPDWPTVYPTKTALAQFHDVDAPPSWMFENEAGGYWLDRHIGRDRDRLTLLVPGGEWRGRWHRIETHVRWSRGDDGVFQVWADGVAKYDYRGPTMTADSVFFKYGVYRSFISRYKKAAGASEVPAQTAYYAAVRRSPTRDGLAPR